ncbi:MAG TPA: cytidylate kinase family protein [Nitrososphaeraceae archaeon]|jgi:cytidylate kinase|nr:cytidylate kinase family protein [Nitrososphaeraceae archaeon]
MSTPSYKNKLLNSIVISGWPAVGKTTIATELAREFGYKHFNGGDVLKMLATEKGYKVSGNNWWDTEEAKNFMLERESNSYFDIEVDRKLVEFVRMGKVVVTSYTLPWLVPESIKIWLKGSRSNRIKRMAKRDNLNLNQARDVILQRDNNNVLIYHNLYGYEFGKDLSVFDFVLDTDLLDLESILLISKTIVKNLRI